MEMNEKKPALRFAGFAEDWEQRKFGDLADYKKGPFGSTLKKDIFVPRDETSIKVYEQQNAINKDWTLERYFITKEYAQKLSRFKVEGGDIIVSCAGTIGEIYELPVDAESGIINQALMKIKVNESIVDKKMFMLLFANMIDDFTRVHSNGSAIKNIPPFSDLKPMEVLIPKMEEEKKISEHITNLDHLITLHQRKYDKLVKVKKSMLEKMFPQNGEKKPELRFAGYTDDWEQRKLGELVNVCSGKDYKYLDVGDVPVYGTGGYMLSVSDALSNDEDAIGIGRKGTIDKPFILRAPFWTVDTLFYCIPNEEYNFDFLYDIFQNINWKTMDESTGVPSLSKIAINDVDVLVPSLSEQTKIGEYFSILDHLITLHQRKLEKLKNIKKSMLEKMFV